MAEMQSRLKDLETALTQKEGLSRSWEEEAAAHLEERNAAVSELEAFVAKGARISSPSTEQSTPTKQPSDSRTATSDESNSGGLPTKPPSSTGSGRVSYRDVDRGHDKAGLPSFEQLVLKTGMNLPASAASTSAPSTPQPVVQTRAHPEEACVSGTDRKPAPSAESVLIQRWVRAAIDMQGNADASNGEDLELSASQDHDQEPPLQVCSEIDGVYEDVVSLGDPPDAPAAAPTQEGSPFDAAHETMRLKMAVRRDLIESSGFSASGPEAVVSLGDARDEKTSEHAPKADDVESPPEKKTGFFGNIVHEVKHLLHIDQKDGTENHTSDEKHATTWKKIEVTQEEEVDLMEKDSKSSELKQKEEVDLLEKDVGALEQKCAAILDSGKSKGQWHPQADTTSSDPPKEGKERSGDQESPPLTPRSPTHGWLSRLGIDFSGSPAPDESTCPDDTVEIEVDGSSIDIRSASCGTPVGDDAASPGNEVPTPDVEDFSLVDSALGSNSYSHNQTVETQVFPDFVGGGCTSGSSLGLISRRRLPPVAEERDPRIIEETELEEVFQQASMLCDSQRYEEALPLFHELLMLLQEADAPSMRSLEAEARAHLGVALQSLGRVEDAIAAYCSAVEQDPSLHVCHANLAQLHAYLEDRKAARAHIDLAIHLDPTNELYRQLDEQFRAAENAPKS